MTLGLTSSLTAVGVNITSSFLASGGTAPYTYSVVPGGAGGTIDPVAGLYQAPATVPTTVGTQYDVVMVTDSAAATATAPILVGDALLLFCDVIQTGMGLDPTRVVIWDQKVFLPTDNGLFVAVAEMEPRVIANNNATSADGTVQEQYVVFQSKLEVSLISRDTSARLRKGDLVMALNSTYAEQQQEANSFLIGRTPPTITNISTPDGAAIPYRYVVYVNIQYSVGLTPSQPYINEFSAPTVATNS